MAKKSDEPTLPEDELEADVSEPEAAAPPVDVTPTLRPVRVETFSVEGAWGYRTVDAGGAVAFQSEPRFETEAKAVKEARDDRSLEALAFPDDNPVSRFGWR